MRTNNPIATALRSAEAAGNYDLLNGHDYWLRYGHTTGTLLAGSTYVTAGAGLAAMAQVPQNQPQPKAFNYQKQFTHAAARALSRGVTQNQIKDAINNPLKVKPVRIDAQGRASQIYIGKNATVVRNPETGKIVSVWRTGTRTANKYSK